jgi:hypothetical protein
MHLLVHEIVNQHNEVIQGALKEGWSYLKKQMATPQSYFYEPFYKYLTERFVYDPTLNGMDEPDAYLADRAIRRSQEFLAYEGSHSRWRKRGFTSAEAQKYGICPAGEYCLGYRTLFQPLKPDFMNILLAMIAAKDPGGALNGVVNQVENLPPPSSEGCNCNQAAQSADAGTGLTAKKSNASDEHLKAVIDNLAKSMKLDLDKLDMEASTHSCEYSDRAGLLKSIVKSENTANQGNPRLYLECFRQAAKVIFESDASDVEPHSIDLLRASIADFLFNYKMSQAYPHEYTPYDLSMSADAFNTQGNRMNVI